MKNQVSRGKHHLVPVPHHRILFYELMRNGLGLRCGRCAEHESRSWREPEVALPRGHLHNLVLFKRGGGWGGGRGLRENQSRKTLHSFITWLHIMINEWQGKRFKVRTGTVYVVNRNGYNQLV